MRCNMSDIAKIDEILTKAEVFYLATVNGDKPKVRPLGFHLLFEDKIYFGVGTFKEVYKQLEANQNVEIAAWDGEHFLRYYGVADLSKNEAVVQKAFELMPEIKEAYEANGWEMGVFYLNNATAEIRNMFAIEESYEFKY
ncbi:pyridoxamine 5'-phosphate oxidase family protein [Methanobrevibacter sp.]|uniref:pyridoxamine 5'-phosphate oxidase family protein n=1 Tax=Methanobrevibacter sp. TaxID=66852 RepID=UPI0025EB4B45|nr:pyridoxamine 5'-phosphate oxidase family protein [Methanobrevibacter sp.]